MLAPSGMAAEPDRFRQFAIADKVFNVANADLQQRGHIALCEQYTLSRN